MKHRLITFTCLLCIAFAFSAKAQRYMEWSKQLNHSGKLSVNALTTHNTSIYVAGCFTDSLLLGNATLKSDGSEDVFLVKYSNNSSLQWATNKGSKDQDQVSVLASAILAANNQVLLGGSTTSGSSMQKHADTLLKTLFVAAWDTNGIELWQKDFPFTGMASLDMLASGADSTLLVGGMFKGSISMAEEKQTAKENSAFIAQLSEQGNLLKYAISSGSGQHRTIAATRQANGNMLFMFAATQGRFQLKGPKLELSYPMESDGLLVISLSPSFEQQWVAAIYSEGFAEGVKLLADHNSNAIAAINFNGSINCNEQQIQTTTQLATTLLRFDENGILSNKRLIANDEYFRLKDIALMPDNNLMLTGYFSGSTLFGDSLSDPVNRHAFITQLDSAGELIWQDVIELGNDHTGRAVSLGSDADVFIGGGFQVQAANAKGIVNRNAQKNGLFVNRYKNCKPLPLKLDAPPMICPDDTLTLAATPGYATYHWAKSNATGNTLLVTEPGSYSLLVVDDNGCKATDTIQIGIAPETPFGFGDEVVLGPGESFELLVDSTFDYYHWSDNYQGRHRIFSYQPNAESILMGLTVQTKDHCPVSDTLIVKFSADQTLSSLNVYPIPAKNVLYWSWTGKEQTLHSIALIDLQGAVLYEENIGWHAASFSAHIHLENFRPGAYTLRLHASDGILNRLIVKQ